MSGMNTTGTSGVSSYRNRTVSIQVTGVCRQDVAKTSAYEVKVPFSQMNQAMQAISRMGGKVSAISVTA